MANPVLTFNGRNIKKISFNGRNIHRVLFNGNIVWSTSQEDPSLSLEKYNIDLSEINNWEDTNMVFTNTTFNIE